MHAVCVSVLRCSVMSDSATAWTVGNQAPLSNEFFRQEYWSVLPFLLPGHLHHSGIEPASFASFVLVGRFFSTVPPGEPPNA